MRHPVHDYTSTGAYFITICAHERHLLFEDPTVSEVISASWKEIPRHFSNASLDAFVVMPNHIHGIIVLTDKGRRLMVGPQHAAGLPSTTNRATAHRPRSASLSVIVRSFKAAVTRELRLRSLWDEQPFWQKNFYDRVVRDMKELSRIRQYISNNPAMWLYDQQNPTRITDHYHETQWSWLENVESSS